MTITPYPTDSEMAGFRAIAEGGMVDTCTITRPGVGVRTFNSTTGQYTNPAAVTVYTGKCRTQVTGIIANSSTPQAGERELFVQGAEFQIPVVGTEGVSIRDTITINTCHNDASLVGRKFTVIARHEKTHGTARRLRVEEVMG